MMKLRNGQRLKRKSKFFDTASFVDTLYAWSAFNTAGIGELIGRSLVKLTKCVEAKHIHLIGE